MIKNCQPLNLTTIFSLDNNFIIDSFQRNYEWGKDQWDDFFESVEKAPLIKDNHGEFMGSIISYRDSKGLHICDGQQRLTTAYIICLYIYNLNENSHCERSIRVKTERIVFNNDGKFRLTFFNNEDEDGLTNSEKGMPNRKKGNSNIEKLYIYLEKKICGYDNENLKNLLTRILDNMCFGYIECVNESSAIKIFNNQSKGKSLSNEDMLNAQLHTYIMTISGLVKDNEERRKIKEIINYTKNEKDKWFLNTFVATLNNKTFKQKDSSDALESLTEKFTYEEIIKNLNIYYEKCISIKQDKINTYKILNNDTILNIYRFLYLNKDERIINYKYKDKLFKFLRNLIINTLIDKNKPGSLHVNVMLEICKNIIYNDAEPCHYFDYIVGLAKRELCLILDKDVIRDNFISYDSYKNRDFGNFMLHQLQDLLNNKEIGVRIENETLDHVSPKSVGNVSEYLINSIGNLTILSHSSNASKNNSIDENSLKMIHESTLPINKYFTTFNSANDFTDDEILKRGKYIFDILYDEFFNYDSYR